MSNKQREALIRWRADTNNGTYRFNYDLNEHSIVFDIGGYNGQFAEQIYNRYNCTVYVFEPVPSFYNSIVKKFKNNSKIKVYNFGISTVTKDIQFFLNDDGTSSHRTLHNRQININAKVVNIKDFINDNQIEYIDLMKLNIEGEEYPLLEYMIDQNLIESINHLQIQFHSWIEGSEEKRHAIQNHLEKTHICTYNFDFVWESWSAIIK